MTEIFDQVPGQTNIDSDDFKDLIPDHIKLISDLNEYEAMNIGHAQKKYIYGRKHRYALHDPELLKRIHQDMFDQTWKWAGTYRRSNKNLGKDWWTIPEEMKKVCEDFKYWKENQTYAPTEIAVRFHYRLVSIHPFPNGNGRHARLVADIFLREVKEQPLSWGSNNLFKRSSQRAAYISALQKADQGDFSEMIQFAKS